MSLFAKYDYFKVCHCSQMGFHEYRSVVKHLAKAPVLISNSYFPERKVQLFNHLTRGDPPGDFPFQKKH